VADLELDRLVSQLPERYQPIYGDEPGESSRAADLPRTASIVEMAELVSRHVGRPLRVLDLGASQGYLAFVLAERGHHVTGVDYLPINVQVARAIHDRHPHLDVTFLDGDVTDAVLMEGLDGFDLVLGMSVLHHVAHRDGLPRAVDVVANLSRRVEHGLFEMALRTEPMYWAECQPSDPRVTLAPYAFIRQVGSSPTHLSSIDRPLLFCSTSLALMNGELHPIRAFTEASHDAAADVVRGKRRYYTLDAGLMKIAARFSDDAEEEHLTFVRDELRHEAEVLGALAQSGLDVPSVLEFADSADETVIAKTTYPGELVSVVNHALDGAARTRVTEDVVAELARYEEQGWYHTDLRLWNVVWDEIGDTAHVIDHGSLHREPVDVLWPGDASYSFVAFLCALWSVADDHTGLTAPRSLPIGAEPIPGRVAAMLEWALRERRSRRFFHDAEDAWSATSVEAADTGVAPSLAWEWLLAFGGHLERLRQQHQEHEALLETKYRVVLDGFERLQAEYDGAIAGYENLHARYDGAIAGYENLHALYDEALESYARLEGLYSSSIAMLDQVNTRHDALVQQELEERRALDETTGRVAQIESSLSWRLTRPLRLLRRLLRR
jgi:O-antigen chain-terminating methyltransferase